MSDPTQADKAAKQLTATDAAKLVRRTVMETVDAKDGDGNAVKVQKPKKVAVTAAEVLDFKDYGSHVVVVTRDGQKLSSLDA